MSGFISIFSINIVLLTRDQKEAIVIQMLKEGYSIREIAKEVHMSFSAIGEIKRKVFGESASYKKKKKLSKGAQALELFSKNKTSIEVSIELDLDPKDVEKIYINYLGLKGLTHLVKIHQDLGNYLPDFISFYWSFREEGADNKKIKEIFDISNRVPSLKSEIKRLQNERNILEIQKKQKQQNLQYLDNQIEITSDILSTEYSNLEIAQHQISNCSMQLQNLKKLINDIEAQEGFLNLEKKIEEILLKIIDEKSINLPLILVAVLETCRNDLFYGQFMSEYNNRFRDDSVRGEHLQAKEDYIFANYKDKLHEANDIFKKLCKIYANKIISDMIKPGYN
jgi:predicted DNA-binding protein YlxM (UPF0122 family)